MRVPEDTGLDIASSSNAACNYSQPPTNREVSKTVNSTGQLVSVTFYLVRCRFGDGSSELTLKTAYGGVPKENTFGSMTVRRSPHQDDKKVQYSMCGASPTHPGDVSYSHSRIPLLQCNLQN